MEAARISLGSKMPPKLKQGEATDRVNMVIPASLSARIEEWRSSLRPKIPGRSEAIRHLIEEGLKTVEKKSRK